MLDLHGARKVGRRKPVQGIDERHVLSEALRCCGAWVVESLLAYPKLVSK